MKYALLLLCLASTAAAALVSTSPRSQECKDAAVNGYSRYVFVQNVPQLQAALANVKPGDLIELRPGNYSTYFTIKKRATAVSNVVLCGPPSANIQGDFRFPAITIRRSRFIRLFGFTVSRSLQGVLVEGSNNIQLKNLVIDRTGFQGVVLRNSRFTAVQGVFFGRIGIKDNSKGQGIWVDKSTQNFRISDNNIIGRTVTGSMILISEGTKAGIVANNTFGGWNLKGSEGTDSWVDIRGSNVAVTNNTGFASPRDGFRSSGINNSFQGNRCFLSWNSEGVCINVDCDAACQSTNTVGCSNTVVPNESSNNSKKLTNIKVTC